ncbi:hypothetical protein C8R46DRAFT_1030627 [Mycena filopes]|nr:hypothetical protein C8R46DRAFT_1030627 [Mycena filopes]
MCWAAALAMALPGGLPTLQPLVTAYQVSSMSATGANTAVGTTENRRPESQGPPGWIWEDNLEEAAEKRSRDLQECGGWDVWWCGDDGGVKTVASAPIHEGFGQEMSENGAGQDGRQRPGRADPHTTEVCGPQVVRMPNKDDNALVTRQKGALSHALFSGKAGFVVFVWHADHSPGVVFSMDYTVWQFGRNGRGRDDMNMKHLPNSIATRFKQDGTAQQQSITAGMLVRARGIEVF